MLGIDISALSQAELRQLLEVARARGQQALIAQLTAEIEARPGRIGRYGTPSSFVLGQPAVEASPPARVRPRRRLAVAITAGVAGAATAALVLGLSVDPGQLVTPVRDTAPPPRVALALATSPLAADDPLSDPVPEQAAQGAAPPRRHNPCYDEPTAADRLVCGYPSLAQREQALKAALQAALTAGADARALEAEQAAWKGERDGVSDREALADLYDRRIRQLADAASPPPPESP
ncbi:MAG: hypothetical protein JNK30_07920 [Phenylobacterium sp.]|uniref:hypothetical protein n=1 Tax=Phenylobacterium sp. TaxID=1871053 RepID=UPI001A409C2B|nr:hypothetical protein [Phenylobacterium sp.]MBL8771296.1 hypothetical protein [Phenylobacterium sp.]